MAFLRRAVFVCLVLAPVFVFGQSADQEVVSAVDAPDPVIPGQTLTYTVTLRNNGPDPAVNGGINMNLPLEVTYQNTVAPAGFTCVAAGGNVSCTTPSFAPGTVQFTVTVLVGAHLANFPDGSFAANFFPSGTTIDPNNGNNFKSATTNYDSPQIDLSVLVADAPDPVFPNGNITYTVDVTNGGPDTATSVNFNSFNNGSLQYQSIVIPSGWSCPSMPAVGSTPTFTCTRASFAPSTSTFTVVVRADSTVLGLNDGTVQTNFSANGTGNDTNQANNSETESTAYVTPDANMGVTVSDSPDPVFPDNDITYTVNVTNGGPDAAPNAMMSAFNNGSLRFQSAVVPAGWNCSLPAVNATPTFSCTNPSFANGGNSTFTVVVRADSTILGLNDGTVSTNFSASSGVSDPNNANNSETESTAYVTPDANVSITASDAPDPVVNGGTLTYAVTATNNGPDAGPSAQVTFSPHPSLTFQSITPQAGWSCSTPAVGASGITTCTKASMANAEVANFTLVEKLVTSGSGGTISSTFVVGTAVQDPVPANNSIEVFTNWIGQTSDLTISKSTLSTAAAQGGTITYTLSTANNGPHDASNVTVTDALPAQLLFQSVTAPGGWSCTTPAAGTNGTVSCSIGTFANGATAQFTIVTTVAPNATGSISNNAAIGSSVATDPTPGNSSGSANAVAVAGTADLVVTKNTNATSAAHGDAIPYTITVTNAGPDPAASVVMTDVLPPSLLFQSINAPAGWSCTTPAVGVTGTITCSASTLAVGAPASFALSVTVAPNATGNITNSASAAHSGTDSTPGDASASSGATAVDPSSADLTISKTTTAPSVAPGQSFAYTISVTNNGPDAATAVVMSDTLPASLLFQSISQPAGFSCSTPAVGSTGTITCNAASLANGATATFILTVQVSPSATSGTITNTAMASAAEDTATGNNSATSAPVPLAQSQGEAIPTLSEWGLMALAAMIAAIAAIRMRS